MSVYQIDKKNDANPRSREPQFLRAVRRHALQGFRVEGGQPDQTNLDVIASFSRNDIKYTKDNEGRKGRHPPARRR
ncbi:hypothetical protein P4110_03045 [Pseudomonas aeruginosa]|nr:hypothetical protein [Pseudomonas aeruginosa]